ncbi:MAG: hypothetical protein EOO85_21850 [Pedobacter sp.]|nr:MAG: hypothetical protein EOO85_21850 [Pedobacter sp.]
MLNQALLNTIEVHDAYGVVFLDGLKNLDRPADTKQAEEKSWAEKNGREYRLTSVLDDYNATLDVALVGNNMAEFQAKKSAFFDELRSASLHELEVVSTGITHTFKYNSCNNYKHVNPTSGVGATFTLDITVTVGTQPDTIIILDGNG